jgi:hypothetical protein
MPTKNKFFSKFLLLIRVLFEDTFASVFTNSRNEGFSYIFSLLMEGSGAVQNNDRPGWPKNIRIRIQIHNTGKKNTGGNKW